MTDNKYFSQFVSAIISYKEPGQLEQFLKAILTPKELSEIPTRLQIIKMLKRGVPQREISQQLGVGVATVTRGSHELHKGNFSNIKA